jgi:hypothetical protein
MSSNRREFSKKTKLSAWDRCKGICECGCGRKIELAEYDHYPVPAAFGGSNDVDNCRVLSRKCHRQITAEKDVPAIAKAVRIVEKRANVRVKKPWPKRQNAWGWGR